MAASPFGRYGQNTGNARVSLPSSRIRPCISHRNRLRIFLRLLMLYPIQKARRTLLSSLLWTKDTLYFLDFYKSF